MENKVVKVMFTGDSVTDVGRARPIGDGAGKIGDSYVANLFCKIWANYPNNVLRILNSAISGNTTRDLIQRFDEDVVAYKPDYLFIMIGVNDAWRRVECFLSNEVITSDQEIKENYVNMVKKCKDNGIVPIFISPLYFDIDHKNTFRKHVDGIQKTIKEVCAEYSVGYIDVQSKVDKYMKASDNNCYRFGGDRVHPNAIAKTIIADCIYASPEFKKVLKHNA